MIFRRVFAFYNLVEVKDRGEFDLRRTGIRSEKYGDGSNQISSIRGTC